MNAFFPGFSTDQIGRHKLFGKKFPLGNSIAIHWQPCLESGFVALYLNVVSAGIEYIYCLNSVKVKRPVSIQAEIKQHNKISVKVDSFEGVFCFITTHENFSYNPISIDIWPELSSEGIDTFNAFIGVTPIKRLQLTL